MNLIKRFELAVRADEMKGAGHPEDFKHIEEELRLAREQLEKKLKKAYVVLARAH